MGNFIAPRASILVVDDDDVNINAFKGLLENNCIHIDDAHSGAECLFKVTQNHYDAVFLDYLMPGMDGIETLHNMRLLEENKCKDTPVIILTANTDAGAKEMYMDEGFDDYLAKPLVPERLVQTLVDVLPEKYIQMWQNDTVPKTQKTTEDQTTENQTIEDQTAVDSRAYMPEHIQTAAMLFDVEKLACVSGIDWKYAAIHFPDMELLQYTLGMYYEMIDSEAANLQKLSTLVETDQAALEDYHIKVHGLKSTSAMVGAMTVAGIAKVLEKAAKRGDTQMISQFNVVLIGELMDLRAALKSYLEKCA